MTATLRFDVAEVQSLIVRGADAVNAREPTFFSKGDLLSPLAALLLQGTFTPEAIQMAQFLVDHGASLNDLIALPGAAHFHRVGSSSVRNSSAGTLLGGENTMNMRLGSTSGRASIVEVKDPPSSKSGKPFNHNSSRSKTTDGNTGNEGNNADALQSPHAGPSGSFALPSQELGTVLHYVVALGDWAHLLQILTIAGQRRYTLPQSLMHEIVLGIMIPPKPSPTEERASSRSRKLNTSVSRQPSRSTSKSSQQGGGGSEVAHAPRSGLPVLKSIPAPFSPCLRLKVPSPTTALPSVSFTTVSDPGRKMSSRTNTDLLSTDGSRPNSKEGKHRDTIGSTPSGAAAEIHLRVSTVSEGGGGEGEEALPLMKGLSSPKKARKRLTSSLLPSTIGSLNAPPPSNIQVPSSPTTTGRNSKGSPRVSKVQIDVQASSSAIEAIPHPDHLDLRFDFSTKSSTGLPVADWALQRGDIVATRLLTFYGAKIDFQELVNGSQTALARACSTGDLPLMERLLDAGDTLTQISVDGRYTLVHYAVAHPPALDYLARRGLSLDFENAFGESALHSLIVHGFGRNAENAIRDCPKMQDAAKLAALPLVAVRNYILMPLSTVLGGGGPGGASGGGGKQTKLNSGRGGGKGNANTMRGELANVLPPNLAPSGTGRDDTQRKIRLLRLGGGRESDTWWSFSSLSTSDMIQHLCDAGANIHGNVPQEECDLRYSIFAEEMSRHRAATLVAMTNASQLNKKRASLPTASLWNEEPFMPYDPNQLWFTESVQFGRKPYRCTPLMCAITAYHPELIRKLVMDYHVDLSRRDSLGASCLHHAAICPHPSALELLFSCGSQEWNAIDMVGRTPLHYAVLMGNVENIKALLRHPATLAGKPDSHGLTPLHVAVLANETAAVGLLLRHSDSMVNTLISGFSLANAKPSRRQKINKSANNSFMGGASTSTLMVSSSNMTAASSVAGGYSVAGSVIGGGALGTGSLGRPGTTGGAPEFQMVEVDAEDFVEHCTPLEFAIKYHRHPAIVQLLLQEGHANMQRWSGLEGGGSLLHRAVVDGREDYVRLLLDSGANPNEADNEDRTPLYFAVDTEKPNIPLIRSLMQADAFPFAQSGTTLSTPLHIAAKRVDAEVLNLLFHERIPANTAAGNALPSASGPSVFSTDDGTFSPPRRPLRGGGILDRPGSGGNGGDVGSDFSSFNENTVLNTEKGTSDRWGSPSSLSISTAKGENGSIPIPCETKRMSGSLYSSAPLISCGHFLSTDAQARTPLHLLCAHTNPAAQQRALPLIEKLVHCDNAVELSGMMDAHGRTPLHYACRATFIEAVRLLLAVDPLLVYHVDANGYTPLHDTAYASICEYPRFLGPPHSCPSAPTVSKNVTREEQEHASTVSVFPKEKDSRAEDYADPNKVEKGEEHANASETEEEPPYSEEEHAQRMEDVIVLIADVVQRSIPRPLRGFPLINSNVNTFSPSLSITQQIMRKHLYENRWKTAPTSLTCTDSSGTPSEDAMIYSVLQYLRVSDHHGRTPLLLAGELGNNTAASILLRIWKVLPMLSSPSQMRN